MTILQGTPDGIRVVELRTPLSDADVRDLRIGDVVFLTGPAFTARDGVYRYMLEEGHAPPIDIRGEVNVTLQSSPAGVEIREGERRLVLPGEPEPDKFEVASLQATAGFRYAKWMEPLCQLGVRAVIGKGGMAPEVYRTTFREYGVVCLSTLPYGTGALFGRAVKRVRDVHWLEQLGISEAMWVLELNRLGPLLVEGDTLGQSYFESHNSEITEPLSAAYGGLPPPILRRRGEVTDPTEELI